MGKGLTNALRHSIFVPLLTVLAVVGHGAERSTDSTASPPPNGLAIPVDGIRRSALRDTFEEGRPGHRHEAIDIMAPVGTKVSAVDDGKIAKLFKSVRGGLTIYQFDRESRLAYYYAHLDRYAAGIREGVSVRRCDVIGYVGTSGNAQPQAPHLHFAAFWLGPERHWWQGTAFNPIEHLRTPCD